MPRSEADGLLFLGGMSCPFCGLVLTAVPLGGGAGAASLVGGACRGSTPACRRPSRLMGSRVCPILEPIPDMISFRSAFYGSEGDVLFSPTCPFVLFSVGLELSQAEGVLFLSPSRAQVPPMCAWVPPALTTIVPAHSLDPSSLWSFLPPNASSLAFRTMVVAVMVDIFGCFCIYLFIFNFFN